MQQFRCWDVTVLAKTKRKRLETSWGRAVPSSGQAELAKLDLQSKQLGLSSLSLKIEFIFHL
jgi:hypothetical protein